MNPRTHQRFDIRAEVSLSIARSGANIETLRGKTVLLTGGTGFFGIWFLHILSEIKRRLSGDVEIYVLSRQPDVFISKLSEIGLPNAFTFLNGDITNVILPTDLRPTHVIHMATTSAYETFNGEPSVNKLNMLYLGTQNLLTQCNEVLESFLFTSSGVAYGAVDSRNRISEKDGGTLDVKNRGMGLALGKLAAEYLITNHSAELGFKFAIARCFSFAGEFLPMNLHYAFGDFVSSALKNQTLHVHGDGATKRSYLYMGDCMAWLLRLLINPSNDLFNVGSEAQIEIQELANRIVSVLGSRSKVEIVDRQVREGNFERATYIPSTEKIRQFYPQLREWTSLNDIILKMVGR